MIQLFHRFQLFRDFVSLIQFQFFYCNFDSVLPVPGVYTSKTSTFMCLGVQRNIVSANHAGRSTTGHISETIGINRRKNTYFNRNGNLKHLNYSNWDHYINIMNDGFCTTTNASESINSAYNKFCRHRIRSTDIVAENIRDFKLKMLNKRRLIEHNGEIKMNKVRNELLPKLYWTDKLR